MFRVPKSFSPEVRVLQKLGLCIPARHDRYAKPAHVSAVFRLFCVQFIFVTTWFQFDLVEAHFCTSQVIGWEGRPKNDLLFVEQDVNPLKGRDVNWLHTGYTWPSRSSLHFTFLTFGHSGTEP